MSHPFTLRVGACVKLRWFESVSENEDGVLGRYESASGIIRQLEYQDTEFRFRLYLEEDDKPYLVSAVVENYWPSKRSQETGRPSTFRACIRTVMGDRELSAATIAQELEERGWAPETEDIRSYVAFALSQEAAFERVRRGVYRVVSGVEL